MASYSSGIIQISNHIQSKPLLDKAIDAPGAEKNGVEMQDVKVSAQAPIAETETKEQTYNHADLEMMKEFILLIQLCLAVAAAYFKNEYLVFFFVFMILVFWIIRNAIKKKLKILVCEKCKKI